MRLPRLQALDPFLYHIERIPADAAPVLTPVHALWHTHTETLRERVASVPGFKFLVQDARVTQADVAPEVVLELAPPVADAEHMPALVQEHHEAQAP